MISSLKERLGLIISLVVMFLILTITGNSTTTQVIGIDTSGNLTIDSAVDKTAIGSLLKRQVKDILPLGNQTITKRDWLLFVDYEMKVTADTDQAEITQPISFKADMPGMVVSSNSDSVDNGKALWNLTPNNYMEMQHTTRSIRWWLIILIVFGMGFLSYAYLRAKE